MTKTQRLMSVDLSMTLPIAFIKKDEFTTDIVKEAFVKTRKPLPTKFPVKFPSC